jgi:hypothetical protein
MGNDFLDSITGNETWVYHYKPGPKQYCMEWQHKDSPTKKKFKAQPSAGKTMCSVFRKKREVILVDILEQGHATSCGYYVETEESEDTNYKSEAREQRDIFSSHDNTR